jgi:hypothetical protein
LKTKKAPSVPTGGVADGLSSALSPCIRCGGAFRSKLRRTCARDWRRRRRWGHWACDSAVMVELDEMRRASASLALEESATFATDFSDTPGLCACARLHARGMRNIGGIRGENILFGDFLAAACDFWGTNGDSSRLGVVSGAQPATRSRPYARVLGVGLMREFSLGPLFRKPPGRPRAPYSCGSKARKSFESTVRT